MLVGFSSAPITPKESIVMGGHPGNKTSRGIQTPLFARAMAISDGKTILVFACADVLFVSQESIERIRNKILLDPRYSKTELFISATHTHSGPLTTGLFGRTAQTEYVEILEQGLISSIKMSLDSMCDSELYHSNGFVADMTFCARLIMKGNRVQTHPFKDDPDIIAPEGIPDRQFSVLSAYGPEGRIKGILVNFAQHPQIMERSNDLISADFPYYLEQYIQRKLKSEIPVIFVNGTCGDVCPVDAQNKSVKEIGLEWCEEYGEKLGRYVIESFDRAHKIEDKIETRKKQVELSFRQIGKNKIDDAREFIRRNKDKTFAEPNISEYGTESIDSGAVSLEDYLHTDCWMMQEFMDIEYLVSRMSEKNTHKIEINAVNIGGLAILTLPFEVFACSGIEIKAKVRSKNLAILELTNGNAGYLPPKKAFEREGGYETRTLYSSRFDEGSEKIVVDESIDLINSLMEETE